MVKSECIYDILKSFGLNPERLDEHILIIRRRLTKKEYKILLYRCSEDKDIEEIAKSLNIDKDRYQKLYLSAIKKIERLFKDNELL